MPDQPDFEAIRLQRKAVMDLLLKEGSFYASLARGLAALPDQSFLETAEKLVQKVGPGRGFFAGTVRQEIDHSLQGMKMLLEARQREQTKKL